MKALELCRRPVVTATAATPLAEVARIMRTRHVGSVVIVSNDGPPRAIGMVTDRDMIVEVMAMGLDPATMTAGDIMTSSPAVCEAADDVLWAVKVMRDRGVRRLPVVDERGELAGLLAFDDVIEHLGTSVTDLVQALGTQRTVEAARRP
jgi:CBS domain-containing protein